ncbi:hypothetical protein MPS_1610 [Mycobacterium pseudoshottsii JCM 15466]|nr:hypothetical protein MMSP_4205 [Mycobacterium sp. 012931]GAQ33348.1 hypothetical protein MPS_1610 [Mycobacterium pseudoshottsii JCM 15466]
MDIHLAAVGADLIRARRHGISIIGRAGRPGAVRHRRSHGAMVRRPAGRQRVGRWPSPSRTESG